MATIVWNKFYRILYTFFGAMQLSRIDLNAMFRVFDYTSIIFKELIGDTDKLII